MPLYNRANDNSVRLVPLSGLFRSQRGVNVSVGATLQAVETIAGHGAWFLSSSVDADVA